MKNILILTWAALFFAATANAGRLSPLAKAPDWSDLEGYQETITREDFVALLDNLYAPGGAWKETIRINDSKAEIQTGTKNSFYVLRFAPDRDSAKPLRRYWRAKRNLPSRPPDKPLAGVRIALDPGHIGGKWARMEERWFRIGKYKPVAEGDMTLYVAKLLKKQLEALGARVFLVRSKAAPVTNLRPAKLKAAAIAALNDRAEAVTPASIKEESEKLFYRTGEIHDRARIVNSRIKPDLVICLHFNAEAWGDANRPSLTNTNHLHLLVSGGYLANELEYDDQRFAMLNKLLSRAAAEEIAAGVVMARRMADRTNLPPYTYRGANAVNVAGNPYLWGRNLLANRLFDCPVIYLEPYVMNSHETFARIQAGDYSGRRNIGGVARESIFQEYCGGVVQGLVDYFSQP